MNNPELPGEAAAPDPTKVLQELEGGNASAQAQFAQALEGLGIRPEDVLAVPATPTPEPAMPVIDPAEELEKLLAGEAAAKQQLQDLLRQNGIDPAPFFSPTPEAPVPTPGPSADPDPAAILKDLVDGEAKAKADLLDALRNLGIDPKAIS
jgi:hypothetical protein